MYINVVNTQNIKNIKNIMGKRKKWISLDKNSNFRNMFDTIKYLESLPIIKYTCKNNHNSNNHNSNNHNTNNHNTNNHNHKKLTKKVE